MTLSITGTTLCYCLHINGSHDNEGPCTAPGCRCQRFSPGSPRSAHHYQRGARTVSKRAARVEVGDVVLVGHPGRVEYVRGADGGIVWEQGPGQLTSHPKTRHIDDQILRPVWQKTGALLGYVTGVRHIPAERTEGRRRAQSMYVIETDLGELPPLFGTNSVLTLAGAR